MATGAAPVAGAHQLRCHQAHHFCLDNVLAQATGWVVPPNVVCQRPRPRGRGQATPETTFATLSRPIGCSWCVKINVLLLLAITHAFFLLLWFNIHLDCFSMLWINMYAISCFDRVGGYLLKQVYCFVVKGSWGVGFQSAGFRV